MGKRLRLVMILVMCSAGLAHEPIAEDRGAAGLWRALKELRTTGSVMHITAHPDDEDGPLLARMSRGQGARVSLLTLNRGEGGANLVTADFFDALGALRTIELLKAGEYYGARLYFTHVVDYGFSKTLDEALKKWGGQENVLREVTRIVRLERPDVILARFQGNPRDGHGNHQTAGIMARLVYEAAGDPNRFPEQIAAGLKPWQPRKLYMDNMRENEDWTLRVNSGEYDPLLGRSYYQIAREGLSRQRSQGAGTAIPPAGPFYSYYKLLQSRVGTAEKETGFFERLDTTLSGAAREAGADAALLSAVGQIEEHANAAFNAFGPKGNDQVARHLAAGLRATREARKMAAGKEHLAFLLARKEDQFQNALRLALGLSLEALVDPEREPTGPFAAFMATETFDTAIPGQIFTITATLLNRSGVAVQPREMGLRLPPDWKFERISGETRPLGNNEKAVLKFRVTVPADAQATRPYWRRNSIQEAAYIIDRPEWAGRALPPPPVVGFARYEVEGVEATVAHAAEVSSIDRTGQARHTLLVAPALSVQFAREMGIVPLGRSDYSVRVVLRNNVKGPASGTVRLELPAGWTSTPAQAPFAFDKEREEQNVDFKLALPAGGAKGAAGYQIQAVAQWNGKEFREGYRTVTYPGLQRVNLYRPAVHRVRLVEVKVAPGLRAGYVMGSGDEVPEALEQLGVHVQMLNTADLATGDLGRFDVILLGIRAYAARSDVRTYNPRLLEYVKNGGTLIVQYQTQEYDHNYGPYPYTQTMRAEEVSEEDSPVEILEPQNPAFNFPNKITGADFDGWVEQRGSKFFATWDPQWKPLLESHDTGQAPQKGGWLEARYGKGRYVYTAYAWYRQLPYAVPGAFRLMANLLSLPKAPAK